MGFFVCLGFPSGSEGKESPCNAEDPCSIPGWERTPGEGNGYPLQYPCLENPMDRGAWRAADHRVTKSQTRLSDQHLLTWFAFALATLHVACGILVPLPQGWNPGLQQPKCWVLTTGLPGNSQEHFFVVEFICIGFSNGVHVART